MIRRITLLTAVVLMLAAGCGDSDGTSLVLEGPGNQGSIAVTDNDGSVFVEDDDGPLFTSSDEIPDDFPFEFPPSDETAYFESTTSGVTTRSVSLTIDADAEETYAELRESLRIQGVVWHENGETILSDGSNFIATALGTYRTLSVDLSVVSDSSRTIVLFGMGNV